MRVSEFDYSLPADLIAQHPPAERRASRLLHLDAPAGALRDLRFADLPALVGPRDVVVLNDTRVVKARLTAQKSSGGRLEVFVERIEDEYEALALIRASKTPRPGSEILIDGTVRATVLERQGEFHRLRFAAPVASVLDAHGALPLPPYITHAPDGRDMERYQTVYASRPGAVAAPTAGLHFDQPMLAALESAGTRLARVTLHVGAGTFQPVRVEDTAAHRMHSERYEVPQATVDAIAAARAAGGRVLAVGTTALRSLESAARGGALQASSGETDLFITPGYAFRVVDRLLTNFHLPRSTLLMLVSAFAGVDEIRRAYAHAVAQRYRFFSYGDAMLIERAAA
jgi:S-adenosylmethionine:tRNA ribosyltransferase-isomerase